MLKSTVGPWPGIGTYGGNGFLLTPVVNASGALQWFTDDGTLVDLGAGTLPSEATVINNGGQIGLKFLAAEPSQRADLLTPADANGDGTPDLWFGDLNGDGMNDLIVDIGAVQGMDSSGIIGLDDTGSVVGVSYSTGGRYIGRRCTPFLWENGKLETLTSPTGGVIEFTTPSAINNARQIVAEGRVPHDFNFNGYVLLPSR